MIYIMYKRYLGMVSNIYSNIFDFYKKIKGVKYETILLFI